MPAITVDWGDAEDGGNFEALEPGVYEASITKVEFDPTKKGASGYPYIRVVFTTDEKKRWVSTVWSLSPKALWRMKQDLNRLGVDTTEGIQDLDTDELVGLRARLKVKKVPHYKDADKFDNDIDEILADDGTSW